MKDYENSNVKYMLSELNRIIAHAEKSVPNVEEGNNQRWEEINFEQLTRDSESRLNVLRREVHALTDIETMNATAKDFSIILERFQKFDDGFLVKINNRIKHAKEELEEAENRRFAYSTDSDYDSYLTSDTKMSFWESLFHLAKEVIKYREDEHISKTKHHIHDYTQLIERFNHITAEFRSVVSELYNIQQTLLEKIEKSTEIKAEVTETEENTSKGINNKAGRKHEPWYGAKWEKLSEEEVELRMKQAYDATSTKLSELKAEKTLAGEDLYNAVWAAIYFYTAEEANVVAPQKRANCIGFIGGANDSRGLYKLGIKCNRSTVLKYYTIVKAFLRAITELDSDSPTVCLLIKIANEENNIEYPKTRVWLKENNRFITLSHEINGNDNTPIQESNIMFVVKNLQILKKIHNMMYSHFSC